MTPESILRDAFGLDAFRSGQLEVIDGLLDGRSMLAVFPTGGGKSLCYQLPALMMDGLTLVVSPLIALMKDQVDGLKERGIAADRLDSSLDAEAVKTVLSEVRSGKTRILYAAPERLANERFLDLLKDVSIAMLAIDEAHCISEWGHNFRPDYLKLAPLAKTIGAGRVLALTATATPAVAADIRTAFSIREEDHIQTDFQRSNLTYRVTPCTAAERRSMLLERLRKQSNGSTIVYVTLQHTAEAVAGFLSSEGFSAKAYHAGLRDEYRSEVQEAFMSGGIQIVVATIAFGMGIDKADIRAIYHFNLPKSLENYVQETGRAGRDGSSAVCEMLACADDVTVLENFAFGDTPSPRAIRHLIDHVLRLGEEFDVSRYELSTANDIRPLVVATLLTYLELRGIIVATRPFYSTYRIKLLRDEASVLAGYDDARREFLSAMLGAAKVGRTWLTIDPATVSDAIGEPRDRITKAVTYLEEAGDIVSKPSGLRQGYRLLRDPGRLEDLALEFQSMFQEREQREVDRLKRVVDYAEHDGCLVRQLLEYFGENLENDCRECSRCLATGETPRELPRTEIPPITEPEATSVSELIAKKLPPLRTPRQMTRFLCGLTSPATRRARLQQHDAFGMLERLPFQAVLEYLESQNFG